MKWIIPKNSDEFSQLFLKRAVLFSSLKLNPKADPISCSVIKFLGL